MKRRTKINPGDLVRSTVPGSLLLAYKIERFDDSQSSHNWRWSPGLTEVDDRPSFVVSCLDDGSLVLAYSDFCCAPHGHRMGCKRRS